MKSVTVRLDFPLERIKQPVVTHLVKEFDVSPNVLAADIEAGKGGWLLVGLSGDDAQVDEALTWVKGTGVGVQEQTQ